MREVTTQLAPLARQVDKLGSNIERLFNSNGGPPGYLQTARAEDKGRFEMIFNILDEHKDEIAPIKRWMENHEILEKDREGRIKRYIAIWSIAAATFMAILALYDHRDAIKHSLLTPDPVTHTMNVAPQDAKIPPLPR